MKRYYILEVETNAVHPEQMRSTDLVVAREVHLQLANGSSARVVEGMRVSVAKALFKGATQIEVS